MIYIIMGVAGSGKTTIGKLLSHRLSIKFYDADDYHEKKNINKMKKGQPLTDNDRQIWLERLSKQIKSWNESGDAVLACSALKNKYQDILVSNNKATVIFICLEGSISTIASNIKNRDEHFFPLELVKSQFDILERPKNGFCVNINQSPEEICAEIIKTFNK